MYVIVMGVGRIGKHLTRILVSEGHDVVVIDKKGDVCHEVARELDTLTIHGDATKPKVLEDAGINEADSLVCLTGSDETNLVVGLMAKRMGAKEVAVRLGATHFEEDLLKMLGIDRAIYPEAASAGYISEMLTKPGVLDLSFVERGNAAILELEVKENSPIAGKKIKELGEPKETVIVALYKDGELIIPTPERQVKPGEKILILTKKEKTKLVEKFVQG